MKSTNDWFIRQLTFFVIIFGALTVLSFATGCVVPGVRETPSTPHLPPELQPEPAPVTTFYVPSFKQEWTDYGVAQLRAGLFEKLQVARADFAERFCPKYEEMARDRQQQAWLHFVGAMVKFESSYNPRVVYQEPPPPKGPGTLSVGLLQMSVGDGYPGCFQKGDDPELLKNPLNNLKCGMSALSRLVSRDGVVAKGSGGGNCKGAACYWSVTRTGHHIDEIIAMTKKAPGCLDLLVMR